MNTFLDTSLYALVYTVTDTAQTFKWLAELASTMRKHSSLASLYYTINSSNKMYSVLNPSLYPLNTNVPWQRTVHISVYSTVYITVYRKDYTLIIYRVYFKLQFKENCTL